MIEASEAVAQVIQGRSRHDVDTDLTLRLAIVRAIEVLGEAASRMSDDGRSRLPDIPWAAIVGMRNRLTHAYFDIDYDIVWQTAAVEVPSIIGHLRAALGRDREAR